MVPFLLLALVAAPAPAAQSDRAARPASSPVDELVADLGDEHRHRAARVMLARLGASAVPSLLGQLEVLRGRDPLREAAVLIVLADMGPAAAEASPALADRLHTVLNVASQRALLAAVGAVGPYAREGTRELRLGLDAFRRVGLWNCREYFRAVTRVEFDADAPLEQLISGLEDPNAFVRELCAELLGERGPSARGALPALQVALRSPHRRQTSLRGYDWSASIVADFDRVIHAAAARAMVRIDPAATETVDAYIHRLGAGDARVRLDAAMALGQYGPDAHRAVPALRRALGDFHLEVVREAVTSLGMIGGAAHRALIDLIRLTADPDREIAARAGAAISQIRR